MEKLSGSLQENLLTLLCFDEKNIPLIMNSVDVGLFESAIYREIASHAITFYQEFKKPVGDHLPDVLEDILDGKDTKKADLYERVLKNLYAAQENINDEYVLGQLANFVRQQRLKVGIKDAVECMQSGKIDEAEIALDLARKHQLTVFDAGIEISNTDSMLSFLDHEDDFYFTGIKELDKLGICPAPKELYIVVALPNVGKSWFLTQIAKAGLMHRKRVAHITLEMSEKKTSQRYCQSLFAVAKGHPKLNIPVFERDELGRVTNIDFKAIKEPKNFRDPGIRKVLKSKLQRLRSPQLIIKEFPTSQLTINGLKAYLENLQSSKGFLPEILLVDYPDLMEINSDNLRVDTGRIYKELRGIAVEYNIAVVTVSQANRSGEGAKLLTRKHLAEDYSKVAIADNLLTLNQTPEEYQNGLARLYVDKGRGDRKGDIILLAQNYAIGQFCLDSVRISNQYDRILERLAGGEPEEEED
ncbi:MAG: hypothetical protein KAR06_00470 [Deltaproteobacteria bacterium]|nr:hypothetical protein [Deltaproteobacteria bacterium]